MSDFLTRGLRNNNPGNLDKGQAWKGLDPDGNDERFCTFKNMEYGCRALLKTLITYHKVHGLNTVTEIINRWAPPVENNTVSYINSVSNALTVLPDDKLDFTRNTYIKLGKAIAHHENGSIADTYISDNTWEEAANLADL